jgi:hypothetical protein
MNTHHGRTFTTNREEPRNIPGTKMRAYAWFYTGFHVGVPDDFPYAGRRLRPDPATVVDTLSTGS